MRVPRIGKMIHPVTWQTPLSTRDSYGQVNPNASYSTIATRHVAIDSMSSSENITGSKPDGINTFKVTQRYMAELQLKDRMLFNGRYFEITGIINLDERNLFQEITVSEKPSVASVYSAGVIAGQTALTGVATP